MLCFSWLICKCKTWPAHHTSPSITWMCTGLWKQNNSLLHKIAWMAIINNSNGLAFSWILPDWPMFTKSSWVMLPYYYPEILFAYLDWSLHFNRLFWLEPKSSRFPSMDAWQVSEKMTVMTNKELVAKLSRFPWMDAQWVIEKMNK